MQPAQKSPSCWIQTNWEERYKYSKDTKEPYKKVNDISLTIPFPKEPCSWFAVPGTDTYRTTSTFYTTGQQTTSGFSFLGKVIKSSDYNKGFEKNELAIFFHKIKNFGGGPEFGWVFRENSPAGLFYILADANKTNQKWRQWPDSLKTLKVTENFKNALKEIHKTRYWNIEVNKEGNFKLSIINPRTWKEETCEIQKPDWFENLYNQKGYITVTAQKLENSNLEKHAMELEQIKLWQ